MTEPAITIFTPTYNRAYTLEKLYASLLRQTSNGFRWLIVDDGSTDNTEALVRGWMDESKIDIEYRKQANQGKSAAHNKGVELTKTELFICYDSDDYLTDDAVESLLQAWKSRPEGCIGVLAYRRHEDGSPITVFQNRSTSCATLREYYDYGLTGDAQLMYQTSVLSRYWFPHFEGEKFVPEAYLYDLLDTEGNLLLLPKAVCVCEYLSDGYTHGMAKLLCSNPKGYLAFIEQRLRFDATFRQKFPDSIRYVAMAIVAGRRYIIRDAVYPGIAALAYAGGVALYAKRYRTFHREEINSL